MVIQVVREILTAQSTIGRLFIDGVYKCHTLEDVDRELDNDMPLPFIKNVKVFGRTAIPRGTYRVVVNVSKKFRRPMPLLLGVPGFDGIRIHAGYNQLHTEGCILVGITHGINEIFSPRQAFNMIFPTIQHAHAMGERIDIAIIKHEPTTIAGIAPAPAVASTTKTVTT